MLEIAQNAFHAWIHSEKKIYRVATVCLALSGTKQNGENPNFHGRYILEERNLKEKNNRCINLSGNDMCFEEIWSRKWGHSGDTQRVVEQKNLFGKVDIRKAMQIFKKRLFKLEGMVRRRL